MWRQHIASLVPAAFDDELRAAHDLIKGCYKEVGQPQLRILLVERPTLSLRVLAVDPPDAPARLVECVTHVLTSEIVNPLHSTGPMVAITGPSYAASP